MHNFSRSLEALVKYDARRLKASEYIAESASFLCLDATCLWVNHLLRQAEHALFEAFITDLQQYGEESSNYICSLDLFNDGVFAMWARKLIVYSELCRALGIENGHDATIVAMSKGEDGKIIERGKEKLSKGRIHFIYTTVPILKLKRGKKIELPFRVNFRIPNGWVEAATQWLTKDKPMEAESELQRLLQRLQDREN